MGSLKEVASVQEVKEVHPNLPALDPEPLFPAPVTPLIEPLFLPSQTMKEVKEVQSRQEGQLSKFTNVVKGWQYRWFVLEPETGQLDYYLPEDRARSRGSQVSGLAATYLSVDYQKYLSIILD